MSLREKLIYEKMVAEDQRQTDRQRMEKAEQALAGPDWVVAPKPFGEIADWWQKNTKTGEVKRLVFNMPPAIVTEPIENVFFFPTKHDAKIAKQFLTEGHNGRLVERIARREAVPDRAIEWLRRAHAEERPEEIKRLRKMLTDADRPVKVVHDPLARRVDEELAEAKATALSETDQPIRKLWEDRVKHIEKFLPKDGAG